MKKLFTIIATISLLALAGVGTARAQVINAVVANIPFDFTVGNKTMPSGQYTVKPVDSSPGSLMTISYKEGKVLEVFGIENAQAKGEPHQAELIFHHVGDRYFLSEIFDSWNPAGAEVRRPRAERRFEKEEAMAGRSSYVTVVAFSASSKR